MFFFPEMAWYVYGSIFIYGDAMASCRANDDFPKRMLFITTLVLIIYTYLFFLALALIIIVFCMAYNEFK